MVTTPILPGLATVDQSNTEISSPITPKRQRLDAVDKARGLAIALVVLGHIVPREFPNGNEWYHILKDSIYLFHMPLFFYLSGFIAFKTDKGEALGTYMWKKAQKFLPGYLILWLIVYALKTGIQQEGGGPAVNSLQGMGQSLITSLIDPWHGSAIFLWFLGTLWCLYLLVPGLRYQTKRVWLALFALSIGLNLISPELTSVGDVRFVCEYMLYFLLGGLLSRHYEGLYVGLKGVWPAFALVMLAFIPVDLSLLKPFAGKLICSLLAIPAILGLCDHSFRPWLDRMVKSWGSYSYSIYLFNTTFIGMVKLALTRITPWDGVNFLWMAPLLFLGGLYLPIGLKKLVLKRVDYV